MQQDFVTVVSACVQQWDAVIGQISFHHGDSSEIASVRLLLQQLDVKGVWVLAEMIQAHRGTTENKLHWVKDVVQGEDASLIHAAKPATLMALLRYWPSLYFVKLDIPP